MNAKGEKISGISNIRLASLGNKLDTVSMDKKEFKMSQKSLVGAKAVVGETARSL